MPHIFVRTVVTSVKKKTWFLFGTILLASAWLLQNMLIDPKNEEIQKLITREQELRFFASRINADEASDQMIEGFKDKTPSALYAHNRLANLINHTTDINGFLGAAFLLKYGDDSLLVFQNNYTVSKNNIAAAEKRKDTSKLISGLKQFGADNDTTASESQIIGLTKRHYLAESVKFWKPYVLWFVILGALFINFDKAREFIKHSDDKQVECKYQPSPTPIGKKRKP